MRALDRPKLLSLRAFRFGGFVQQRVLVSRKNSSPVLDPKWQSALVAPNNKHFQCDMARLSQVTGDIAFTAAVPRLCRGSNDGLCLRQQRHEVVAGGSGSLELSKWPRVTDYPSMGTYMLKPRLLRMCLPSLRSRSSAFLRSSRSFSGSSRMWAKPCRSPSTFDPG